jgi:hypothetical protein
MGCRRLSVTASCSMNWSRLDKKLGGQSVAARGNIEQHSPAMSSRPKSDKSSGAAALLGTVGELGPPTPPDDVPTVAMGFRARSFVAVGADQSSMDAGECWSCWWWTWWLLAEPCCCCCCWSVASQLWNIFSIFHVLSRNNSLSEQLL